MRRRRRLDPYSTYANHKARPGTHKSINQSACLPACLPSQNRPKRTHRGVAVEEGGEERAVAHRVHDVHVREGRLDNMSNINNMSNKAAGTTTKSSGGGSRSDQIRSDQIRSIHQSIIHSVLCCAMLQEIDPSTNPTHPAIHPPACWRRTGPCSGRRRRPRGGGGP